MKIDAKLELDSINRILTRRGLEERGKVQKYIDSTVLRLSDPYVPMLSGQLKMSGIRGTVIGKGEIVYNAPYAEKQYYNNAGMGRQGTAHGGKRGAYWFERMKIDHLDDIIRGAAQIAGGDGSK